VHDALLTYGVTIAGETAIVVRFYALLFVIFLEVLDELLFIASATACDFRTREAPGIV
jgi:hypothetical protein